MTKTTKRTKYQKDDPIEFQREPDAVWESGAYIEPCPHIGRSWHAIEGAERPIMFDGKQIGTTTRYHIVAQRIRWRKPPEYKESADSFMRWCESVKPCKYCGKSFVGPTCPACEQGGSKK